MSAKPLNVVVYWHMHQPQYKDVHTGEYQLPWTYLHVIKDYIDMAAHLEACPQAHVVVNFTPTLLEQIDDYNRQIQDYFTHATAIKDAMLEALIQTVLPARPEQRLVMIKHCLRANEERLIKRYPQYERLAAQAKFLEQHPEAVVYIQDQYLVDLNVWFHLAWMGETVRRSDLRIRKLMDKGMCFSMQDRAELLSVIGELCATVIGRYRALAERGQIELSMTPYAHPIMPLLLDMKSAHDAMPDAPLPGCDVYPGGEERVHWHIDKGMALFQSYFGFKPHGCWPSEGSVSERTIQLLAQHGVNWVASGETVLRNSLSHEANGDLIHSIHRPYLAPHTDAYCFFRDDGLSDLIGFTYATWHADDAVANLVHHLENIADACADDPDAIVSIILDGENAWEYYPENGYYFLKALYEKLSTHPGINLTTYSRYLAKHDKAKKLNKIVAGSWVYGTFSTWIGSHDKNLGWDMLCDAKKAVDKALASGRFTGTDRERIEIQLAICEGSDWFWWFGDYNPAESVSDFERLYRLQLTHLYKLIGETPPEYLAHSFTQGGGSPSAGGTMRRGQEH
ncbi:MAG: glycoside hydrolase [Gammaproteobacteria bacterium]|nr:glycoside hydrolase [Gammaproteobacteria bacterium]